MLSYTQNKGPESDSENDLDYVPPPGADESSEDDDEQPELKRVRAEIPERSTEEEERKRALWESFQASVNEPNCTKTVSSDNKKMVKVCKRYLFAGEEVIEAVDVPEDSPDAKKWPLWRSPTEIEALASTSEETESVPPPPSRDNASSAPLTENLTNPPAPALSGKRPGPRKPKTRLPELPGRTSTTKVNKLTTLDKSVMDWKAHVHSSENQVLQDELEANRRGGGYLESVAFLRRVDERKDAVLDAANTSKRKRS